MEKEREGEKEFSIYSSEDKKNKNRRAFPCTCSGIKDKIFSVETNFASSTLNFLLFVGILFLLLQRTGSVSCRTESWVIQLNLPLQERFSAFYIIKRYTRGQGNSNSILIDSQTRKI